MTYGHIEIYAHHKNKCYFTRNMNHLPDFEDIMSTEIEEKSNFAYEFLLASDHAEMVLKLISLHRDKEQLCDVILIAGLDGKRVPAHRLMLSVNSKFFTAMFTNPMQKDYDKEVTLGDVNCDVLKVLVSYCYTGKLDVREDNVKMLLNTARSWQMDAAVKACVHFMVCKLNPSNCLRFSVIAESYNCSILSELVVDYIRKYFVEISQCPEFLQLTAEQLGKLLSDDQLQRPNEENVFQSLMTWLQHDEPARKQHLPKLLANVRLPLLELSFIEDHVESVCKDYDCQHLLTEAYKYHAQSERLLSTPRRNTETSVECLLAIGQSEEYLVMESYCPILKQWKLLKKLSLQRNSYGAAVIDQHLLLVGGMKQGDFLNNFERLDLTNMTWTQLTSISTPRCGMGVAVLKGLLYVFGGNNETYLNIVERWDPATDIWSTLANMPTKRAYVGVAMLYDSLYVIGGFNKSKSLSCVERYDAFKNEWTSLSDMNLARAGAGVAEAKGLLYAVGGRGSDKALNSVECYNPTIDKWTIVCSLADDRYPLSCALFANRLFAAGGYTNTVEKYDPVGDVWKNLAPLNDVKNCVGLFVIPSDVTKSLSQP